MKRITYKKGQIENTYHSGFLYSEKYDKYYIVTWNKASLLYQISDLKTGGIVFSSPYSFCHHHALKNDIRRKLKTLGVVVKGKHDD